MDVAQAISDLQGRILDWKGYQLSALGHLHLFDVLHVEKWTTVRSYHTYLFSNAIFCLKERRLSAGSTVEDSTNDTNRRSSLSLKGRVWLRNIQQIVDVSTHNNFRLTFDANDRDVTFTLLFDTEAEKDVWKETASKLLTAIHSTNHENTLFNEPPHSTSPSLSQLVAELDRRILDWEGSPPETLGPLQLSGTLTLRRDAHERQLQLYLFHEAMLCVIERAHGRAQDAPAGERNLRIKGRIFIRHIKNVSESAGEEHTLAVSLHNAETFHIVFEDRQTLELWASRLRRLMTDRPLPDVPEETDNVETDTRAPTSTPNDDTYDGNPLPPPAYYHPSTGWNTADWIDTKRRPTYGFPDEKAAETASLLEGCRITTRKRFSKPRILNLLTSCISDP